MIVHIALFKFKSSVSRDRIDKLINDTRALKEKIPSVINLYAGKNFSEWNEGYTHAVVVLTKDREGLNAYRKHKFHMPIARRFEDMEDHSIGFDFES